MGFSFFIISIISLFKITQKEYVFNMEIIFIMVIMTYVITVILYNISDKNINKVTELFMHLIQIILFIGATIMVFGFILFRNASWIKVDVIWVFGLFLLSCWKLIDINDFKNDKNEKE